MIQNGWTRLTFSLSRSIFDSVCVPTTDSRKDADRVSENYWAVFCKAGDGSQGLFLRASSLALSYVLTLRVSRVSVPV